MNKATKLFFAREILVFLGVVVYIIILALIGRHLEDEYTAEYYAKGGYKDSIEQWNVIILSVVYPIRWFVYLVQWAVNTRQQDKIETKQQRSVKRRQV